VAEQGDVWAQRKLGNTYAKGDAVPQDYVKAHVWLNLAASQKIARLPTAGINQIENDQRTVKRGAELCWRAVESH